LDIIGFFSLAFIKYFTVLAIPGWATNVAIGLTVILFLAFFFLMLLSFVFLSYRTEKQFIPEKDFGTYILSVERIYEQNKL
jgi:multidrug efflux pump subunit AcrB